MMLRNTVSEKFVYYVVLCCIGFIISRAETTPGPRAEIYTQNRGRMEDRSLGSNSKSCLNDKSEIRHDRSYMENGVIY